MVDKPANPPKPQSLDEIVSRSAVVIAEQIRNAAGWVCGQLNYEQFFRGKWVTLFCSE